MNTHKSSNHSDKAEKDDAAVASAEPKKETKAQAAEHEVEKVTAERDALTAERDRMAARVTELEAFLTDSLKIATWDSTAATELLAKKDAPKP